MVSIFGAMVSVTLENGIKVTLMVMDLSLITMGAFTLDNGKTIELMELEHITGMMAACTSDNTSVM